MIWKRRKQKHGPRAPSLNAIPPTLQTLIIPTHPHLLEQELRLPDITVSNQNSLRCAAKRPEKSDFWLRCSKSSKSQETAFFARRPWLSLSRDLHGTCAGLRRENLGRWMRCESDNHHPCPVKEREGLFRAAPASHPLLTTPNTLKERPS